MCAALPPYMWYVVLLGQEYLLISRIMYINLHGTSVAAYSMRLPNEHLDESSVFYVVYSVLQLALA